MTVAECLGVEASIAGLLAAGNEMVDSISDFSAQIENAPGSVETAHAQIKSTTEALKTIRHYLLETDRFKIKMERKVLIQLDHISTTLAACVVIYADLERYIDYAQATLDDSLYLRQWLYNEREILSALTRLQTVKLSLDSMTTIFGSDTLREAREAQKHLVIFVEKILWQDTYSSTETMSSVVKKSSDTGSVSDQYSISEFTGESDDISTIASTRSSRSRVSRWATLVRFNRRYVFSFEKDLEQSWVYKRAGFLMSKSSLTSRVGSERGMTFSELSKLSLGQISSIAVFSLPLRKVDLYNSNRYKFALEETGLVSKRKELEPLSESPQDHGSYDREELFTAAPQKARVTTASVFSDLSIQKGVPIGQRYLLLEIRNLSAPTLGNRKLYDILPPESKTFTGRKALLDQIQVHLLPVDPSKYIIRIMKLEMTVFVLHGGVGTGKTAVASEFAHIQARAGVFQYIFWIDAADEEIILTRFCDISRKLGINTTFKDFNFQNTTTLALEFCKWLRTTDSTWLLVFDGLNDHSVLSRHFCDNPRGAVLITTRNSTLGDDLKKSTLDDPVNARCQDLHPLTEAEAILMFNSYFQYTNPFLKIEQDYGILNLLRWVGYVPVGVMAIIHALQNLKFEGDESRLDLIARKKFRTPGALFAYCTIKDAYTYVGSQVNTSKSLWEMCWDELQNSKTDEPTPGKLKDLMDLIAPLDYQNIQHSLLERIYNEQFGLELQVLLPESAVPPPLVPIPSDIGIRRYSINRVVQMGHAVHMSYQARCKAIDTIAHVLLDVLRSFSMHSLALDLNPNPCFEKLNLTFDECISQVLALHSFFWEWSLEKGEGHAPFSVKFLTLLMLLIKTTSPYHPKYMFDAAGNDVRDTVKEILAQERPASRYTRAVNLEIAECNHMFALEALKAKNFELGKLYFRRCENHYKRFVDGDWETGAPYVGVEDDAQYDHLALAVVDASRCMVAVGRLDEAVNTLTAIQRLTTIAFKNGSRSRHQALQRGHASFLLGSISMKEGLLRKAFRCQITAQSIFHKIYSSDNIYTARANALLGWHTLRMSLYEEAIFYSRKALEGFSVLLLFTEETLQHQDLQKSNALLRYWISQAFVGLGDEASGQDWLTQAEVSAREVDSTFPKFRYLHTIDENEHCENDLFEDLFEISHLMWGSESCT